jgi:hypothetical protein
MVATANVAAWYGWSAGGQMVAAFSTAGVVSLVLGVLLIVRHELELAGIANGMASAFLLVAGIVGHFNLVIAFGAAGVAIAFIYWGGRRKRRRVKRVLGNKSRQLRGALVRRMRQRRVARPGWSPSPSR